MLRTLSSMNPRFISTAASRGSLRPPVLWGILLLGLLVANGVHVVTRSWESSFYQTSYATIYFPTDVPTILEWHEKPGGIEAELNWDQTVEGWVILKDGEPHAKNDGTYPFFPEIVGDIAWADYIAIPQPAGIGAPLKLQLRFIPEEYWTNLDLPRPDSYMIRSDEVHGQFKQYPVSEWIDDYSYLADEDLTEIDRILEKEIGVKESDGTLLVLEKLTAHFRDALGIKCRGNPDPDDRWRDPFTIYQNMRYGEGQGYCTQHAQVFLLFANRAGLSSRLVVTARTKGNNFIYSGHSWVETWVPEQGRWAWGDPSFAFVYATNTKGELLNSIDLAQLRKHAAWDGVTTRLYKDWAQPDVPGEESTFIDVAFPDVVTVVQDQFETSAIYKWRRPPNVEDLRSNYLLLFKDWEFFWGNLERYYFKPPLAIANYATEGNRTYLVRHVLLWSLLASLVGFVISLRRRRSSETGKNSFGA